MRVKQCKHVNWIAWPTGTQVCQDCGMEYLYTPITRESLDEDAP